MNDQWINLYTKSGWDINKIDRVSAPYSEPFSTHLTLMVNISVAGRLPIVIPRIDTNKQLHFYLVGKDEQQTEEIFSIAKAYLGTSYTAYSPMTFSASEDAFEQSVLRVFPKGFKKISIYKASSDQNNKDETHWVMASLNKAFEQYHQRPLSVSTIKRPIGVILRHFFIAVQNHLGADALRLLDELKNHQRLSPRNVLSLEIQALASGGQWQKVLQHSKLDDLVKGTIPRRLQNVLLDCVGYDKNNSTIPANYTAGTLSQQLQNLYPLFSSSPDLENDDASVKKWKLWAIGAVSLGRTVATEKMPSCIDSEWINELRLWAGIAPVKEIPVHGPEPSISDYLIAEISLENAAKLLAESVMASFKDNYLIYLRLCEYPAKLIDELVTKNSRILNLWTELKTEHGEQPEIDSWHHLFQKLSGDCNLEQANSALMITIDRSEYWSDDDWQEDLVISDIKGIADDIARGALRGVLPILIKWLEVNKKKLPSDAIEHLMILLVTDDQIAAEDLLLSSDLLVMLLNQGYTKEQYTNVIDCIDECWSKTKSPRSVDSVLEVYEILIDYPCPNENSRIQSWQITQSDLIKIWTRLDNQQHQICHEVALFLYNDISALPKISELLSEDGSNAQVSLSGKCLAIYTLTEGAGRRAQKILMNYFPGLQIKLNHDKTATDALLNLAETADYFIFASRSAAHQAFYALTDKRKDLIYPQGKGSSSIVRIFDEFINRGIY
jgi:hypothetical protein